MRHDCDYWCTADHGPLLGPPERIGRPAYGTYAARARRRAANRRARAARRSTR